MGQGEDMNDHTTVTIENKYGKYTVTSYEGCEHVDSLMLIIKQVILASGYAEETVREYIPDE